MIRGKEDLAMSWTETCAMTERIDFVSQLLKGERGMTDLCEVYGISRKTGYKWLDRFRSGGGAAMTDRSHAPLRQPRAVAAPMVARLLQVRAQHPSWGPRKLLAWLEAHDRAAPWPAASTVGEILRRHGLVQARRRRPQSAQSIDVGLVQPKAPNDLWCTDFKGQFRTQDGRYCYPLTLTDSVSRYLLTCKAMLSPSEEQAKPWFARAFRQYGLPTTIRSDNGSPFASNALGGLSRLSVWWIKLGIVPERIEPGCPQQNGRHERMHRTLKAETTRPAGANLLGQQRKFDSFVNEFNFQRPHEALEQRPPSVLYRASDRPYPSKIAPIQYPDGYATRQVRHNGQIKFAGQMVFVSEVLCGEPVGLYQVDEHLWRLYFSMVPLGILDTQTMCIIRTQQHRSNQARKVRGAPPPTPPVN
jgi:transposase InsO family protein